MRWKGSIPPGRKKALTGCPRGTVTFDARGGSAEKAPTIKWISGAREHHDAAEGNLLVVVRVMIWPQSHSKMSNSRAG